MPENESTETDTEADTESPQAAPEHTDPPQGNTETPHGGPTDDSDDGGKLRREAARYRRSLRDAEAERDSLRGRLDVLQRAAVERVATADGLAVPGDLWLAGVDLAELLDDGGNVDHGRVRESVAKILDDRPHWRRAAPVGFDGGVRQPAPAGVSMQQLLQGRKRR